MKPGHSESCECLTHTHTRARTHTHAHTRAHTHTEEYYSAVEKSELSSFAATCTDLEGILLNEVSQTGR